MPQATDIVLDGAGYMLAPGKSAYRRTQDGIAEGRTGRTQIRDFFGGQRRKYQMERDKSFGGISVGPTNGGQAVVPWPFINYGVIDAGSAAPSADVVRPHAVVGNAVYYGMNNRVYKTVDLTNNTWATPTNVKNLTNTITSICYYGGNMLVAMGGAADLQFLNLSTLVNAALFATERANSVVAYSGFAIYSSAKAGALTNEIRMITGGPIESRFLDNQIIGLTTADAYVYALTRSGIYRFSGRVTDVLVPNPAYAMPGDDASIPGQQWTGDFTPFFQHGSYTENDDFRFFLGLGGKLYTNFGKFIAEYDPNGDRAGWKDTGLNFYKCYGATVAAGYLIVTIVNELFRAQVWAWDGSGWWKILDEDRDVNIWHNPIPLLGAGNYDVMLFHNNTHSTTLLRLVRRSPATAHNVPDGTDANYVTSLIDADERDKDKAWRKIGAVFADPEPFNALSVDAVDVYLDYSTDNGTTWTQAATRNLVGSTNANHNFTLNADIASASAVSRFLQLRVRWASLTRWAPTLVDCWAEFELLDSPARRRRWIIIVKAADQVIDRDGSPLAVTGRQLINQLWTDWQTGTTIPFRDIDYDDVATTRNVRIIGIEEDTERPADHGRWGHSLIKLTLVEV